MAELAFDSHHDTTSVPWPEQGSWTWDDYLRLPDDGQRYEIIHGVLYVSPAPRFIHQVAVTRLAFFLSQFVVSRHLGTVLVAPLDVLLPGVAEPVQPDVLVLKNENLPDSVEALNFQGVPDFVAEVLSPSSKRLDRQVKLRAYEEAGVPEYWIVDPQLQVVVVHRLGKTGGYQKARRFEANEVACSTVFDGFALKVSDLFP